MTYREIGISIRSAYTQGWPDDASRLAFRTETRKLFRDAGWQVGEKPLRSGHCDKVRNGKDALYLHPDLFSGVMQEDHIPALQQLLSSAATFRVLGTDLRMESQPSLTWSHYAALLQVPDSTAREWYAKEADEQMWSVRTLQRNISSQYYYRMLQTQKPELVESEMKAKTSAYAERKLEFIKNPVVAEFLGLSGDATFTETDLETSIISNLQKFLMELGKGYAFVARQQHIRTEKQDYYIDLVFYNYILKCFVLIDLKTEKITHQDVGQMDMYIRMYDELKRSEGDNPTIGIVLCSDTDADIARYSILNGNEQLFATKYKLYLPTEEELRAEIESQKAIFYLQQQKGKDADL